MKKVANVCIIDDDHIFIYGAKRLMRELNFCEHLSVYSNGQEALEELTLITNSGDPLPTVIFLDLNMPIMNGWEFLEDFIKLPKPKDFKTAIYVISSSVDPRDLERIKTYPLVKNYILKPMTSADLVTVLSEVA